MPIHINPPYKCVCDYCGEHFPVSQVADHSALHNDATDKGTLGPRGITCPKCKKSMLRNLEDLGVNVERG